MAKRKTIFTTGEYYHIYNGGVDGREIFHDARDIDRFFRSLTAFNDRQPVGGLRTVDFKAKKREILDTSPEVLVDIVAYCLNRNHFHLILRQKCDGGVSEFMKRLSGGYAWYFNNKYHRKGVLFEGPFQSAHIDSEKQLLFMSIFVNLNFRVHKYRDKNLEHILSSWDEYSELSDPRKNICSKESILGKVRNQKAYVDFAEKSLIGICEGKKLSSLLTLEQW